MIIERGIYYHSLQGKVQLCTQIWFLELNLSKFRRLSTWSHFFVIKRPERAKQEMSTIKFTSLLHLSDKDMSSLKLVFNSNWQYNVEEQALEVVEKLGDESRFFDLLDMYRSGEVAVIKESVKTHNPDRRRFKNGDIVFCFIPYTSNKDWMLVNAYKVLDDSKWLVGADENYMAEYQPYFGRLVVHYEDKTHNILVRSPEIIDTIYVKTILEHPYNELGEDFPGYENVDLSWNDLRRVLRFKNWQTALENQKAVYLITDTATNKRYVGSAYGDNMLLGRWRNYAENGHGGNKELKALVEENGLEYVKNNFRYSILDIYKSTTDDEAIIARESWWKNILLTRGDYGYNAN